MKYIKKYSLFEEINPRDISYIFNEFDEYFTLSFEFEIETDDKSEIHYNFSDFDEEVAHDTISIIINDYEIRGRRDRKFVKDTIFNILDHIEGDLMDVDVFNSLISEENAKDERQLELLRYIKAVVLSFIGIEDLQYLKRMVKEHLSDFYRKWWRKLDFVGDATLERGIEIKPKTYCRGITESIEMLTDFFDNLSSQEYWKLSQRTGLHVNVGTKSKSEWNPIKGLLLLNDFNKNKESTPLVFKEMTWRMNNNFCGSLIPWIQKIDQQEKDKLKTNINLANIKSAENVLNSFLTEKIKAWGIKNFGFNFSKIQSNYVEFRYVGGVVDKELVIEKLKYFCFIVFCMTNPEYKRKEYLKKLYTFVESI